MEPNQITYEDANNINKILIDLALRALAELHAINKTTVIINFTVAAKADALQISCSIAENDYGPNIKGSNIRDILDEYRRRNTWLKEQTKKIPHLTIAVSEKIDR